MAKYNSRMRAILFVTCLLFALATGTAGAATFLQYASQPGDYVGGGGQGIITSADAAFSVSSDPRVTFVIDGPRWMLIFAAPGGQPLVVGSYENALRAADATAAGLDVEGEGRGCNQDFGRFTVLEIVRDAAQNVTRFAADFEQHCELAEPALYGGIRFNSDVPYVPQPPTFGPAFIDYVSQPGDFAGGGLSGTFTRANVWFSTLPQNNSGARLLARSFPGAPYASADLWFAPAAGQPFVPGIYEDAQRFPFNSPGHPGMDIAVRSTGCDTITGRFMVYEVEYGPLGSLKKFAADFEQHCAGATPWLRGGVRFNSTVPYVSPLAGADHVERVSSNIETLPYGQPAQPFVARAVDAAGNPLANVAVTFNAGSCGTFDGASSITLTSGASGIVTTPPMVPGNVTTICTVSARVPGGSTSIAQDFPVYIYNPATLVLTAMPDSVLTVVDQAFSITFEAHSDLGAMPGFVIGVFAQPFAGAYPVSMPGGIEVDSANRATLNLRANAVPGSYEIVANAPSAVVRVPVTQLPSQGPAPIRSVQDRWWAGPPGNGWGLSLVQHRDTLFGALYIYDASGKPTWLVMPGGAWDATNRIYTGSLYTPSGAPFFAYDAARVVVGNAKGSMTLTLQDNDHAVLDYTIDGTSGRKLITREIFASGGATSPDHSDLWWGGVGQSGWGITIVQQGSTLFPIWYTYDASGAAAWYVMPDGAWTASDTYEGHVYRTTGSPWIGHDYDPTKLQVFAAGTFRIRFNGDAATFDYTVDGHTGTMPLVREAF